MTEDLNPQEEVLETTPAEESESANSELDSLFAEVESKGETVSREEFDALKKGVAKFFSEQGRKAKAEGEPKSEEVTKAEEPASVATPVNSVLKSLYFKSNPEAEMVWAQVENEAKKLNKDPFELYESSNFFKGEGKTLYEKKRNEEDAKAKIGAPSSLVKGGKLSYDKIDLANSEHLKWLKEKPERITEYNDWIKFNWKK